MYHVTEVLARRTVDAGPTWPRDLRQQDFVLVRTVEHRAAPEWWPADSRELDWRNSQ